MNHLLKPFPEKRYSLQDAHGLVLARAYSFKQAWDFMEKADQFGFDVARVVDRCTGYCVLEAIKTQFEGAPLDPVTGHRIQFDESEIPY